VVGQVSDDLALIRAGLAGVDSDIADFVPFLQISFLGKTEKQLRALNKKQWIPILKEVVDLNHVEGWQDDKPEDLSSTK